MVRAPARLALLVLLCALSCAVRCYTDPDEIRLLFKLKDELVSRGIGYLLGSWTCPDMHDFSTCNPCGANAGADDSWGDLYGGGAWAHIACRTYDMTPEEFGDKWVPGQSNGAWELLGGYKWEPFFVSRMGVVTNLHLCSMGIEGTLESLGPFLCPFKHAREFKFTGSHFTGPLPEFLSKCYPHLWVFDLAYNQLSGSIPTWVANMGLGPHNSGGLQQFKVEHNQLNGTIPPVFGKMPNLRVLWLSHNDLSGAIPDELADSRSLISFDTRYNPKLCGPLPPNLKVDWDWQWQNSENVEQSWYGFCDKAASENSACGILATQGTHVARSCSSVRADQLCGADYDQCGGAPSPIIYKSAVIGYDVYNGTKCCNSDLDCVVQTPYFSQCLPKNHSTEHYKAADHSFDGLTDIALQAKPTATCSSPATQCYGPASFYNGPTTCCDPSTSCVQLNYYYGMCLNATGADAAKNGTFGTNLAAQAAVLSQLPNGYTGPRETHDLPPAAPVAAAPKAESRRSTLFGFGF